MGGSGKTSSQSNSNTQTTPSQVLGGSVVSVVLVVLSGGGEYFARARDGWGKPLSNSLHGFATVGAETQPGTPERAQAREYFHRRRKPAHRNPRNLPGWTRELRVSVVLEVHSGGEEYFSRLAVESVRQAFFLANYCCALAISHSMTSRKPTSLAPCRDFAKRVAEYSFQSS